MLVRSDSKFRLGEDPGIDIVRCTPQSTEEPKSLSLYSYTIPCDRCWCDTHVTDASRAGGRVGCV